MIKPTIGRTVLFNNGSAQRVPATICFVHSDDIINIGGFTSNGTPFARTSIKLCQNDEECQKNDAEWMPYQKQQAGGTENTAD